ncbi:methionyl-tRNA formyltransferase [Tepidimonas taiwanensis]|uniref:Bifunctional polymyxin resistance protein ArnA n=2 Tax=Tepidimonas taiwanensis TaxID=307486 RepID=A0A554X672_9BURK|nr:methionyl-tRNA formyltransferase [Tepidimonas taiwanensis]TSE31340.1 Bifunctional polymyxin resistance protein ArnA [Tepidimonas taiwanensis]UBQ06143.1 methionyl-tRNA formyltransferase [Tepidimonas taiwanensis]
MNDILVRNVLHADVASYAAHHGLPCRMLARSMTEPGLLEAVAQWEPDAFLVVGWYHMVPKAWRSLAPAYGLHASLLPDYSGGAPLVWAMINGETKTGITLFQLDDGVDSGPIVAQAEEPIHADDTIATLYARIEERGLELLARSLPALADGSVVLRNQPLSGRRIMPQRTPKDGVIDWTADYAFVERFIRAQTRPYPGAFSMHGERRITIWAAHGMAYDADISASPGEIIFYGNAVAVVCGQGALVLDEIECEGNVFVGHEIGTILREGGCFKNHRKAMK